MKTKQLFAAALLTIASAAASAAPTFSGSWDLYSGKFWGDAPAVYTAQQAAAFLFGGNASDYVISTMGDNAAWIDNLAWYDQYGYGPAKFAANHMVDAGRIGYYDVTADTSALIRDNAAGRNMINYAFRVESQSEVPEPLSVALLGVGLLGFVAARRKRA